MVGAVVATAVAFPSVGTVPAEALETPGAAPVVNAEKEPVEPVGLAETVLVGSLRVISAVESVVVDVEAAVFDGPSPPHPTVVKAIPPIKKQPITLFQ